jgi:hypothetical protein
MTPRLNFLQQRDVIDAELDHDLRHANLPTTDPNTRCLAQIIRLLRMVTQAKPEGSR